MKALSKIRAHGDTATVLIYEVIGEGFFGGLGAKAFVEQLQALGDVKTINLRINSDGGSVFEGVAIYNALVSHPAKVNVIVDGIAASIASVIAMAGDTIKMQPTATMMIHNAHAVASGDCNGLREVADILEMINGQMTIAYARSKMDPAAIAAVMNASTWYTAEQAVAAGWADGLVEKPLKMAASLKAFDLKALANVPAWLIDAQSAQASVDGKCTCPCDSCLDGDCDGCTDPDCDCEGCECDSATASASAKNTAKPAESSLETPQIDAFLAISQEIESENLRLAEL